VRRVAWFLREGRVTKSYRGLTWGTAPGQVALGDVAGVVSEGAIVATLVKKYWVALDVALVVM
jgi:hypothetical protein